MVPMLDPQPHPRRSWQFGLWALLASVTLMAMLLAFVHYWIYGPESFRLLVVGTFAAVAVAVQLGLMVYALLLMVIWLAKK